MQKLSNLQKLLLAKQFNLIVRALNDYQLLNWSYRNDPLFNNLVQNEKDFLYLVEFLLEDSTVLMSENAEKLVTTVDNFCTIIKEQLKTCELAKAVDIVSRAVIVSSSFLDFTSSTQSLIEEELSILN